MDTLTVKDLMTAEVEALYADETLDLAETIMNLGRVRHLPVLDRERRLVGLVTHRDLLRASCAKLKEARCQPVDKSAVLVEEIMSRDVATVGPETPIHKAAEIMFQNKFGCFPVVAGDRLVGIITESDFVRYVAQQAR